MTMFQLEMLLAGFGVSVLVFAVCSIWLLVELRRSTQRIAKMQQMNLRSLEAIDARFPQVLDACRAQPAMLSESATYLKSAADDIRWQATNKDIVLSDQLDILTRQYRALVVLHSTAGPARVQSPHEDNSHFGVAVAADDESRPPENRSRTNSLRRTAVSAGPIRRLPLNAGPTAGSAKGELITLGDHFSRQISRNEPARQYGKAR